MALIRYNDPFRSIGSIRDLEDWFEEVLRGPVSTMTQTSLTTPVADIYLDDKEENLVVEAHMPGYNEDDIDIDVENGRLNIRAEHSEKESDKKKGRKYVVKESSSSFYRQVGLPKNADADKISADFDDGILKVTIPMKDLPKPKKIAVGKGGRKKLGAK